MIGVIELSPKDVGTPVPVAPQVPSEAYTYDYIVVGGGTAGCVLASRLSEDPTVSVLLIEQGPVADTWMSRVPFLSGNHTSKDFLGNKWWSLPLRGADNRFVEILRGEALGGASRINAMLYTRGTPGDYNRWTALGNEGWGYDDLEPYFIKSEKTHTHTESKLRGHHGIWENTKCIDTYKPNVYIDHALRKAGISNVQDFNTPDAPAACTGQCDITRDTKSCRHSTYRAFLPPAVIQERKARLKICTKTLVTGLELSEKAGELYATGVQFEATYMRHAMHRYVARARREIVLCAGALGSPQILMLSGIGPKEHLLDKGISVMRDMPAVGSHLSDHMAVPLGFEVPMSDSIHRLEGSMLEPIIELAKFALAGGGVFSQSFQNISTFLPTHLLDSDFTLSQTDPRNLDTSKPENRPDIELIHVPCNCTDFDHPGKGIFTLMVALIRPKSEGCVRLATSNPRAKPDVDVGFLTDPEDYTPVRKGVRFVLRIIENVRKQGYRMEGLDVPAGDTDEDVDRFIRAAVRTCFHYTSTCRMGKETHGARPSVVDTELRVHGVRGLRVCDTSVFPEIIGSHTMAPAVMVAEKCADMMRTAREG